MASLALGAAGAFIGGSIGGPLGAKVGWLVGAALGNALFPGKGQDGPRMTDLKVHNSSYGQMIPITYGTVRIAGNVIWTTDWIEHEQHSGGKGGPEETSYTYTISFAVGICEGPIGGVLRIWADSRLVWDPSSMDPEDFPFTLYLGTATQDPDPTMEAVEGVGNVSAHRDMAYAVFTDFPGAPYNNHVPSMTWEVYHAGGTIPWRYSTFDPANNESRAGPAGEGPQSAAMESGILLLGSMSSHAQPCTFTIKTYDLNGVFLEELPPVVMTAPTDSDGNGPAYMCINQPHAAYTVGTPNGSGGHNVSAFYYDGSISAMPITVPGGASSVLGNYNALASLPMYWNGAMFGCGGGPGTAPWISKWAAPNGQVTSGVPTLSFNLPGTDGGAIWSVAADTVTGHIWCAWQGATVQVFDTLYELDEDLNLIYSWAQADYPAAAFNGYTNGWTVWNNIFYFTGLSSSFSYAYYVNADKTFTLADTGSVQTSGTSPEALGAFCSNSISLGAGLILTGHGIISLQPRASGVTLASIVSDLSVRAGLTTDQIDVEQLTDLVDGYVIGNQMAARSAVEPLQVAWPFDAVEHDVVVRFPRRGVNGVAAVIDDDDLGAFVPPGDPPALLTTQRLQEVDLPRIVDCSFLNVDTDYQEGEARAQRLITTSEMKTAFQLPIVMSSQKGLSVCEEQLYNAWIERERFSLSLSRKWLLLEPADIIQANGRQMRIMRKVEQADGVIKVDSVAISLPVYSHLAPPVEGVGMPGGGGTPPTAPPVIQDTDALLLDLPLISDADNPVGFYAAFAGHTQPSWPGATLYKSIDGGSSFNPVLLNTIADTFGTCSTTLGDFSGGNIVDESNSLTVVVTAGSGTLASVTNLALMNGANMAAVGVPGEDGLRSMEIIQFRDATLVGTRTYTLTGLLRGRRGSEWVMPSHGSGETFVLLPTSTNVLGDPAELFLPRIYRAVTSGRPLASAGNINFQNYGMALLPYAPVHLNGEYLPSGNAYLQWTRRTRIGGLWRPFVDVPLSESLERYRIKIYTDSTYTVPARIDTVDDIEQYIYTVADQLTDFGSPTPATIYWGVSQQGTASYGTEARGTL